ncbi:MAG: 4-hydroxy-tetrahydrodipicolinate reductase, partial [Gammaproteobacteria bacterium]|nr:4-hydroxy-tetrahydrodipicolinate reductase [Gammaproteobacteria bacterium]
MKEPRPTHALVVFGITGRMGQSLLQALGDAPEFSLAAAVASADSASLGKDAALEGRPTGVPVTADAAAAL